MAVGARRNMSRRVAVLHEVPAARENGRRRWRRFGRRMGKLETGKIGGDLAQIVVGHVLHQVNHRCVRPPAVAEAGQLVVQVSRGLARDAGRIAIGRGSRRVAMADTAGAHALGDRIGYAPLRLRRGCGAPRAIRARCASLRRCGDRRYVRCGPAAADVACEAREAEHDERRDDDGDADQRSRPCILEVARGVRPASHAEQAPEHHAYLTEQRAHEDLC